MAPRLACRRCGTTTRKCTGPPSRCPNSLAACWRLHRTDDGVETCAAAYRCCEVFVVVSYPLGPAQQCRTLSGFLTYKVSADNPVEQSNSRTFDESSQRPNKMPNMTSYHLEPRLSASHPAPQRKRCCIVCRAGGTGQERVFACDLPVARDEPVYACLLPEPATSRPGAAERTAHPPWRLVPDAPQSRPGNSGAEPAPRNRRRC